MDMMTSWEQFVNEAESSLVLFNGFVTRHALEGRSGADHICYKCSSHTSFEDMRALLEPECAYVYQAYISGRRIAYLKFKKPLQCSLGEIWFLELSDQKPDGSQKDAFDHIEVFPTAMSYEHMVEELEKTETVIKVARPHHTTHDIDITPDFLFRCTQRPLIEKIRDEEMK